MRIGSRLPCASCSVGSVASRGASAALLSGPVGIACNPASGKDIRRLTARASVFDNQEKRAIVRRAVIGALAAGAREFRYLPDTHEIAASALAELAREKPELCAKPVDAPQTGSTLDTIRGAEALHAVGCAAVLTLGGDGTNRAFARGWPDAPLLPISTGTNNVFPRLVEATVAGAAAGGLAAGHVTLAEVARRQKAIHVEIESEPSDLALVDAVLTEDRFVGSRALMHGDRLRVAVLSRAEPAAVGITAIGGQLQPVSADEDCALLLEFGSPGVTVHAPIAPGLYQDIRVRSSRKLSFGELVELEGGGALAFDGERERVLRPGGRATLSVERDGPWVIDVDRVLERAAEEGWFRSAEQD